MLGLRVSADVKNKLDEAARKSGRSQSQEAEIRLQKSFDAEELATMIFQRDENLVKYIRDMWVNEMRKLTVGDLEWKQHYAAWKQHYAPEQPDEQENQGELGFRNPGSVFPNLTK
jgi:hypothetical protein